ncbi:hypothetical protein CPC08DRAFT_711509 [Agrocybe pediades]|nr:hypothetical protein CPC08DRAFT_711509 [Agrocybe pediades]
MSSSFSTDAIQQDLAAAAADEAASRTAYLSSTITSLIACVVPMIGLMYLCVLSWTFQRARRDPRPVNKASGVRLQRWGPVGYVVLVLSSLVALAFSSWLILQYRFNHNYPNVLTRNGVRLLLFTSSWTTLTAGTYTLLFVHPTWSMHPVASIGSQAIWTFVTWLFWVVGAGVLNASVPGLLDGGRCVEAAAVMVYCGQMRGLFGVAVVQSLMLSAGMLGMLWLAWQSARFALVHESFPMR